MPDAYRTLDFTQTFLADLIGPNFTAKERGRFLRALRLLDENDRHPSLRVDQLEGDQLGTWSASASDELRMTFQRSEGGLKLMLTCSRHYAR